MSQLPQDNKTLLLTPGPLTTARDVRQAMMLDWGSREEDFTALTRRIRSKLITAAEAGDDYTALMLQGSGTFAVEAMLGTFVPPDGKLLVLINGGYGHRMVAMCKQMGRAVTSLEWPENEPVDPLQVQAVLRNDDGITHVAVVHVETTTGLLNPIEDIARVVQSEGRRFLVDAMASFGALPLNLSEIWPDAVAASSNKCLESTPGIGIILCNKHAIGKTAGNSTSLSLDLHGQWLGFEGNSQWRFTPPVQVVAALDMALDLLEREGGPAARLARYRRNCDLLLDGMAGMKIESYLRRDVQAPIITTFHPPAHAGYSFNDFHAALLGHGFAIYPGKLTKQASFRVGCIGQVFPNDIWRFLHVAAEILQRMGAL